MAVNAGIFGDGTCFEDRYVTDHKKLQKLVSYWKDMGLKIVLTSGTYDLFHVGHAQYLEKAKKLGDVLIVGMDSDEKVRKRKGPNRPVVPEGERARILSHIRHVDVITLKGQRDSKNHLIKLIHPDILVISKSTGHGDKDVKEKTKYCGKVVVMPPQSITSTSAKVRLIHVTGADQFAKTLVPRMSTLIESELTKESVSVAKKLAAQIPVIVDEVLKELRDKG